jgi:hypothetical protein
MYYLEPIVAIMICSNALLIGISLDHSPKWQGWETLEFCFAVFFTVEVIIRFRVFGIINFFLGADWAWNCFDFIIATIAAVDFIVLLVAAALDEPAFDLSKKFTLLRMVRMIRIARLVRILKFRVFKELQLMINGVVGGLRTLLWAIFLLMIITYILGVILRQLVVQNRCCIPSKYAEYQHEPEVLFPYFTMCVNSPSGMALLKPCTWGEERLQDDYYRLFASVPRSMFTVFRCFTDGCNTSAGAPLVIPIWDVHGIVFVIFYVFASLVVTFGLFNLIMAIFVENTLEYARQNDEKRRQLRQAEDVNLARTLQTLVMRICTADTDVPWMSSFSSSRKGLLAYFGKSRRAKHSDTAFRAKMKVRISRPQFEAALQEKQIQALLDEIDVSLSSREKLFDILDADGNGYLAISEIVDGIMRLRGPADKGDAVAASLMMRSTQANLREFEQANLANQESIFNYMAHLDKMLATLLEFKEDLRSRRQSRVTFDTLNFESESADPDKVLQAL